MIDCLNKEDVKLSADAVKMYGEMFEEFIEYWGNKWNWDVHNIIMKAWREFEQEQ